MREPDDIELLSELKCAAAVLAAAADAVRTVDIDGERIDLLLMAERFDALIAKAAWSAA